MERRGVGSYTCIHAQRPESGWKPGGPWLILGTVTWDKAGRSLQGSGRSGLRKHTQFPERTVDVPHPREVYPVSPEITHRNPPGTSGPKGPTYPVPRLPVIGYRYSGLWSSEKTHLNPPTEQTPKLPHHPQIPDTATGDQYSHPQLTWPNKSRVTWK